MSPAFLHAGQPLNARGMSLLLLAAASMIVPAGARFTCTPVAVWDGDGPIWCAEGPRIRLAGIAAREIDGSCRKGHPCPGESGRAARDHLVQLLGGARGTRRTDHVVVRGPVLTCRSNGAARGTRTGAFCRSATTGDLSCAMVRSGYALAWARYDGKLVCRSDQGHS